MRTIQLIKNIENILLEGDIEEYKKEAKMIAEFSTCLKFEKLILDEEIDNSIVQKAVDIAHERINTKKPIQYILGQAYFMGNVYKVNKDTLIPRDETEFLVIKSLEKIKNFKKEKIKILDIGTGAGIIPISIALKIKNVEILGVDISTGALTVAIENAQKYLPPNIVLFRKSNIFSNIKEKFDIIVSNPPYIPIKEKTNLQQEVLFEPETALFTEDDDGIYFYKKIIENSKEYLFEDGYLMFEIGINQANQITQIFKENKFKNIEIIKDLANIERVICAQY